MPYRTWFTLGYIIINLISFKVKLTIITITMCYLDKISVLPLTIWEGNDKQYMLTVNEFLLLVCYRIVVGEAGRRARSEVIAFRIWGSLFFLKNIHFRWIAMCKIYGKDTYLDRNLEKLSDEFNRI